MKTYYLKLSTGPLITLQTQSLGSAGSGTESPTSGSGLTTNASTTSSSSPLSLSPEAQSSSAATSIPTSTLATTSATLALVTQTTTCSTLSTTQASISSAAAATNSLQASKLESISPVILKDSPFNAAKSSVTGSFFGNKSKARNSNVTSSAASVRALSNKRNVISACNISKRSAEAPVLKSQCPGSGSSPSPVNVSSGAGSAAAARLMDLGRRLLEATRDGQTDSVRQLIVDAGAPFTSDWLGTTALHLAAQNGFVEIAEILLNGGVNRDAKTKLDRTALHLAAQSGSVDIVDLLILNGCDVHARDMLKMTPMHWAAERGHTLVVERLLVAGADPTIRNKFLLTPIDIANNSECYDVIKLFNTWMGSSGFSCGGVPSASSMNASNDTSSTDISITASTSANLLVGRQYDQQQQQQHANHVGQDLNQLFSFGVKSFSIDDSPMMTQAMGTTSSRTSLYHRSQQQQLQAQQQLSDAANCQVSSHESRHDLLNFDHQLALIDCASGFVNSSSAMSSCTSSAPAGKRDRALADSDKCIDSVELEWNNLDFVPELFMPPSDNEEGEANVEYLMKVVEELQKENKQLRQQVEQLSTTSP